MTQFALLSRLYLLAKINQQVWEVVGGPRISPGTINVFAGMSLKTISAELKDKQIAARLFNIGKGVFSEGSAGMSYDGDDWPCGNGFIHGPHPHGWQVLEGFDPLGLALLGFSGPGASVELNPQPLPPRYLGAMVSMIGEMVSSKQAGAELNEIGQRLMGGE